MFLFFGGVLLKNNNSEVDIIDAIDDAQVPSLDPTDIHCVLAGEKTQF